jgi:hypothetical protein
MLLIGYDESQQRIRELENTNAGLLVTNKTAISRLTMVEETLSALRAEVEAWREWHDLNECHEGTIMHSLVALRILKTARRLRAQNEGGERG